MIFKLPPFCVHFGGLVFVCLFLNLRKQASCWELKPDAHRNTDQSFAFISCSWALSLLDRLMREIMMAEDWVWSLFACPGLWMWAQLFISSSSVAPLLGNPLLPGFRGKGSREVRQRKKSNPFFFEGQVAELMWELTLANSVIWFVLDPHLSWSCVTVN